MALPSGANWIVGGVVAAGLLPAMALGVGLPFALSVVVSGLAGGGLVALLAPRRPFEALEASGVARARLELARELLTEAEPQAGRIDKAGRAMRSRAVGDRAEHLAATARAIFAALEKDPLRIDRVRRFLTYYLPRAAEIAEAYVALEQSPAPDGARIAAVGGALDRLDQAFSRYAADLRDADLDKLDIELKLLKGSLDEDLGPAVSSPKASD